MCIPIDLCFNTGLVPLRNIYIYICTIVPFNQYRQIITDGFDFPAVLRSRMHEDNS